MTELKREYVIPLRRKTRLAPRWRRSKKAVSVLKDFVKKHMKTDDVILCSELNELIWANGARNPPGKVSVVALKKKIGDSEATVVNLASVGVDKQLESYAEASKQAAPTATAPANEGGSDKKDEVQEGEVTEKVTEKSEEKKEAPAKEEKKEEMPKKEAKAKKEEASKKEDKKE